MNKSVYLRLSKLELIYEFWNNYVKSRYEKAKLCYMDTEKRLKQILIIHNCT